MDRLPRGVRSSALQRLARLSSSPATGKSADLDRLSSQCVSARDISNGSVVKEAVVETSQIPMSLRELEVLLALCEAAPTLQSLENAEKLVEQLAPYMTESFNQRLGPSPFFRDIAPSPWERLTSSLTTALLSLGLNFESLRERVHGVLNDYVQRIIVFCQDGLIAYPANAASLVASLIGFLESSSELARFWTPSERLALVLDLQRLLSTDLLANLEDFSALQVSKTKNASQWKWYIRNYDAADRPLGILLLQQAFMKLLLAVTSLLTVHSSALSDTDVLGALMSGSNAATTTIAEDLDTVDPLSEIVTSRLQVVEEAGHSKHGSPAHHHLALSLKASFLSAYCACIVLNSNATSENMYEWLQTTIADPIQMSHYMLATTALKSLAVLSRTATQSESDCVSILHRFIVEAAPSPRVAKVAAFCLSHILESLPQDATITTLNTLGHVLSSAHPEKALKGETLQPFDQQPNGSSSLSLVSNFEEHRQTVYSNVIEAIVGVAINCKEEKMVSLAQSILTHRLNKFHGAVTAKILTSLGPLTLICTPADCKTALAIINETAVNAVWHNDQMILDAIFETRVFLAKSVNRESQLYDMFLVDMLESVSAVGDNGEPNEKRQVDELMPLREIEQYFHPLALLLARNGPDANFALRYGYTTVLRDFWLICAINGISYDSELAKKYSSDFKLIAKYTPPLIAGVREDESFDSNLDESSILTKGLTPQNMVEHKRRLTALLPGNEHQIKTLPWPRVIFLEAAHTLECWRAEGGGCSKVLAYFVEPAFKSGDGSACMVSVCEKITSIYISQILAGSFPDFYASRIADQLADVFVGCCHRLEQVQSVAVSMADRIINIVPSALCRRASLFALLELLTLMWDSCLEEETDEYSTRALFTSRRGRVAIEMPDSYSFRRKTFSSFHARATVWVSKVLDVAPLDLKGLLQTYLSEFEDESSLGHISVGRSFAMQMGGTIPKSDQRLASVEYLGDRNTNIVSDFVKQYTVRQAYRHGQNAIEQHDAGLNLKLGDLTDTASLSSFDVAQELISRLENKNWEVERVPIEELRDLLRKAASLICHSEKLQGTLIRHLIGIPFTIFSKQAIKLGMLLWTGVINEKPELQSRMLVEIARNFELTVQKKMGLFAEEFGISDAFDVKMEYAPSDKEEHIAEQQAALDLLSPHLRLLQLLSSHYHANRHGNPQVQKIFLRLVNIILTGLQTATGHPLARESRFQAVLFGLQVMSFTTGLTNNQRIRMKDLILSAGLSWFKFPPRWSFGGNRLQVKAEAHLMRDVANMLNGVSSIGGNSNTLRLKRDLLLLLVENESTRLATWLYPLDHSRKHHLLPNYSVKTVNDAVLTSLLQMAWQENPAIAVQLHRRFQSTRLEQDTRRLISLYPEKVIGQRDAVKILLTDKLQSNVTFQLRYLLYWAPVDPITAVTYFLPGYKNNPFILQYAMRALESHSVDVTFFYVPQIVQTLRYDALGYVERFIIETAKFSQLFAHQIIWNMKANAYKDEDSQIPDPVKPTLDKVMERLINSFSDADKDFYEREFNFFNEVTSISGKLRPYIKRPKPEKNQKIAEELQKIKVDAGVYLPSNPDSVVIDIDRDSGKSLQSHAKAPYMATFRISRKTLSSISENDKEPTSRGRRQESVSTITKEMWQAAIFKVGDDCRQDMLALQLISTFRSIFNSVGLDVYVFPYRVTATAPGCGVIDVLPKSISRDMLGRDYDMGLYDYFINKYGGEDSIRFQEARNNFVKSMAAYSVISYLLKFKDRHNGNIMLDDAGHILHIDFGFCFDIAPGGITFERAPFKLTAEMVSVMGGSLDSQPYLWFEELCIKAFLACRPYVDTLTHCVILMLDSGLPCFKPETIQNFRQRFELDKSEREAADYMRYLVKKSYSSYSTGQYDRFQRLTNGIPY